METSLNRIGINLDSVQSDIMQVNRGSKEILLEGELFNSSIHGKVEAVHKLKQRKKKKPVVIVCGIHSNLQ